VLVSEGELSHLDCLSVAAGKELGTKHGHWFHGVVSTLCLETSRFQTVDVQVPHIRWGSTCI
jgi:hypothetical protein